MNTMEQIAPDVYFEKKESYNVFMGLPHKHKKLFLEHLSIAINNVYTRMKADNWYRGDTFINEALGECYYRAEIVLNLTPFEKPIVLIGSSMKSKSILF